MVPVHYKCTNASRNFTGYMSRPPAGPAPPLPMAPPPVPQRPWSMPPVKIMPSSTPDMKPPPKAPPVTAFNVWRAKPREFEAADNESARLLVTKALTVRLEGLTRGYPKTKRGQ